jgi:hypothetical protein
MGSRFRGNDEKVEDRDYATILISQERGLFPINLPLAFPRRLANKRL